MSRNRIIIVVALVATAVLVSDALFPESALPPLMVSHAPAQRRCRGDWETPDTLVVAYTGHWPDALADLVTTLAGHTPVAVLANMMETPEEVFDDWRIEYAVPGVIDLAWSDVDTPWVRDYGPIQTIASDGTPIWLDAAFDRGRVGDQEIPMLLAARFGVKLETSLVPLDGGALISNGDGLCAATDMYLQKLPVDLGDDDLDQAMLAQLGCRILAVLPALSGEETHHVDMFAQFLSATSVAVASSDDPIDGKHLDEAARRLSAGARELGIELAITRVPIARTGEHAYRTYVNGVRAGSVFLVPSYADVPLALENEAYRALEAAMPTRSSNPCAPTR